jgi:hypothetical protein
VVRHPLSPDEAIWCYSMYGIADIWTTTFWICCLEFIVWKESCKLFEWRWRYTNDGLRVTLFFLVWGVVVQVGSKKFLKVQSKIIFRNLWHPKNFWNTDHRKKVAISKNFFECPKLFLQQPNLTTRL